ncbi:MAG TPA: DUF1592 domain-containing protein, partial [Verrucomicrobiae bacterium]|nr:DUF1592 domain-containing protein [Verrucomicrobiae bacterium]
TEREKINSWIKNILFHVDCNHPDPGRVTIRRLNRSEYNNTIRDLVGIDFQPAADFPVDDSGYGFDNIGDALSLSPLLFEKYLAAAEQVMDAAIVTVPSTNGSVRKFEAEKLKTTAVGGPSGNFMALQREGEVIIPLKLRRSGQYRIRARAYGEQAGSEPPKMEIRLDDKAVKVFDVTATEGRPRRYDLEITLAGGEQKLSAAYINNYNSNNDPEAKKPGDRNLLIDFIEVTGPLGEVDLPETHERIFFQKPRSNDDLQAARAIIERFAQRAYRRPLASDEMDRLQSFFSQWAHQTTNFESAIKMTLQAVLISPDFLFRGELQPEPDNPASIYPVNEYALASRLSYFLWSTMPDEQLMAEAARGSLRSNLVGQVRRMLADPRANALIENFTGQWLQTRSVATVTPSRRPFRRFSEELRAAMQKETALFCEEILRKDRSVLDFLTADYTYVNERLAEHYGITGVKGEGFQRVSLAGTPRRGVLTQGSILTLTSNPTRTSPVKRGLFVLDNILGTPPPPPPPDVPLLPEGRRGELTGTLRQRMEQHRKDTLCASCHARMDPIGFSFENFDGIGSWREEEGGQKIDASGTLVSGESFSGAQELTALLLSSKRPDFLRCLAGKMLTYALGRGTEYYDSCAIDQIVARMEQNEFRFSELVIGVVQSAPFQLRRGEGDTRAVQAAAN